MPRQAASRGYDPNDLDLVGGLAVIQKSVDRLRVVQLGIEHVAGQLSALLQRRQNDVRHQHKSGADECRAVKSDAHGETYGRRGPQSRRRGQTRDVRASPHEDHAAAQKADAGNDLRAHTQGVGVKPHRIRGVQPHQRRHGGAYAHENVGAHARCPPSGGALRADQPAQHGGQEQPDHGGQEGVVLQHLNELTHGRSSFFRKMAAA